MHLLLLHLIPTFLCGRCTMTFASMYHGRTLQHPFVVLLSISFLILSTFVTPHIHRSILISATANVFSCAFFNAHVPTPYTSVGLSTVLYTFPLIFTLMFRSHNAPDTLFQLFHQLCTMWVTYASSSPSSAIVHIRYVNCFTLFTVSPCKWISAS